jgi:steroid delta-isomerase-like uncharacterized protein
VAETKTSTNAAAKAKQAEGQAEPKPSGRRRITRRKAVEAHVRSYFDAIAARDTRAIAEHWTEEGVDEIVAQGPLRGRREIAGYFAEVFAASPDVETSVTRVVAGERQAAVEWRMQGTFDGAPFQGIEPTGKSWELRGLDLMDVEDGQITGNTAYFDGAEFARQVGMLPPQDSGAERAMKNAFNAVTKVRRAVNERRAG